MPYWNPKYTQVLERRLSRRLPLSEYTHVTAERLHKKLEKHDQDAPREKSAADIADLVIARCKLAEAKEKELAHDIQQQHSVYGQKALEQTLPKNLMRDISQILDHESSKQTLMGIGGGAAGGLLGGAGGALTTLMTHGKQHALAGGLLGIAPGLLAGYVLGRNHQQKNELADLLRERLR
jgi:hypothetical protein